MKTMLPLREGMNAAQEISITAESTSPESNQQTLPADSESTVRAELLGKVLAAQANLEAQLAELQRVSGDARLVAECSSQLSALIALQGSISAAAPGALTALRSEVATSIAAAATTAQQARTAASGSAAAGSAQLAAVSAATRSDVQALARDLFERRIFDKYLTFDPPEEEEAYRRREAENRRYSAEQLARNIAEGNLNAAGAAMGQMLDAHAHGAGKSPDFLPRWNQLVATTHRQRDAMRAEGKSTEEFDRCLAEDVRRFLKAQGVPEARIEALLAASPDPLEAVKPYLKTEQAAESLGMSLNITVYQNTRPKERATMQTVTMATAPAASSESVLTEQAAMLPTLDDVMAKLRASGVTTAEHQPNAPAIHGVTQERPALPGKSRTPAG